MHRLAKIVHIVEIKSQHRKKGQRPTTGKLKIKK